VGRDSVPLPADKILWILAGVIVLLPVLQLVPLPAPLWHGLAGREVEVQALSLIGQDAAWRPLSLSPPKTLAALLALAPPLIALLMIAALDPSYRRWVLIAVAGMAVLSVLLGAMQLAGGGAVMRLYSASHHDGITGFQANRNATADV